MLPGTERAIGRLADEIPQARHMLETVARQSKLLEKAFNVLVAVEYARLCREDGSVRGVDPKKVLKEFDDLVLAIRETKGAGLRMQDDGWYGEDKES